MDYENLLLSFDLNVKLNLYQTLVFFILLELPQPQRALTWGTQMVVKRLASGKIQTF